MAVIIPVKDPPVYDIEIPFQVDIDFDSSDIAETIERAVNRHMETAIEKHVETYSSTSDVLKKRILDYRKQLIFRLILKCVFGLIILNKDSFSSRKILDYFKEILDYGEIKYFILQIEKHIIKDKKVTSEIKQKAKEVINLLYANIPDESVRRSFYKEFHNEVSSGKFGFICLTFFTILLPLLLLLLDKYVFLPKKAKLAASEGLLYS